MNLESQKSGFSDLYVGDEEENDLNFVPEVEICDTTEESYDIYGVEDLNDEKWKTFWYF